MGKGHDKIYRMGPVVVTHHAIKWPQLGPDLQDIADLTLARVITLPPLGNDHRYLNPMFTQFT
jgi:hypothetical protein